MKTYVIVHGSIRVEGGFKKTGETIDLEEAEAKRLDSQLGKPDAALRLESEVKAEKAAAAAAEKAKAEALAKAEAEEKAKHEADKKAKQDAAAAAEKAKGDHGQKGGK